MEQLHAYTRGPYHTQGHTQGQTLDNVATKQSFSAIT